MANNSGKQWRKGIAAGAWSSYDRLPKEIKRMLQEAPFNYSTRNVTGLLRKLGKERLAQMTRENIAKDTMMAAKLDFGPDHPQAQA